MTLKRALRRVTAQALRAAGDVKETGIYDSLVSTAYDASAGVASAVYASVHDVEIVFTGFTLTETGDAAAHATDKRALIAAETLVTDAGETIRPKPDDRIRHGIDTDASTTWRVIGAETDPAEALWVLAIRRP